MAQKIVALKKNYGFRGGLWNEGDVVELNPGEKAPNKYWKLLSKEQPTSTTRPEAEAQTLSGAGKQALIEEAEGRGIKDAKILSEDELLKVLAKDATPKLIADIIKKAKAKAKK
jgi:hypothetical protein